MDICVLLSIVIILMIAVVMYILLINAGQRDKDVIDEPCEKHSRFGKYIFYIGLIAILVVIGLFIGLRGCEADVEASVTTTVENTGESVAETSEPVETIHIEETGVSELPSEAPSAPTTDETVVEIDPDELEMLACVIYQEAGGNGSCDDCRRYVADVVLNRMAHPDFPDTMYEVLTQKDQYGRLHYTGIKWPERATYDVEQDAVERAYRVAEEVLSGLHSKLYGQGYIWQAGFVQGSEGFWCCDHWYGR